MARTGNGRSDTYKQISEGLFPPPVARGEQGVAWVDTEIEALIQARIDARDQGLRGKARKDFIRAALASLKINGEAAAK
jgi:prophage regulatory protein